MVANGDKALLIPCMNQFGHTFGVSSAPVSVGDKVLVFDDPNGSGNKIAFKPQIVVVGDKAILIPIRGDPTNVIALTDFIPTEFPGGIDEWFRFDKSFGDRYRITKSAPCKPDYGATRDVTITFVYIPKDTTATSTYYNYNNINQLNTGYGKYTITIWPGTGSLYGCSYPTSVDTTMYVVTSDNRTISVFPMNVSYTGTGTTGNIYWRLSEYLKPGCRFYFQSTFKFPESGHVPVNQVDKNCALVSAWYDKQSYTDSIFGSVHIQIYDLRLTRT